MPKKNTTLKTSVSEGQIQKAFFLWCDMHKKKYPELEYIFAIPNQGGYRTASWGVQRKLEGMKAGVPDIFLPVPKCGYGGLFIELKKPNNKPTANQQKWIKYLTEVGYKAKVITTDNFLDISRYILKYLNYPTI